MQIPIVLKPRLLLLITAALCQPAWGSSYSFVATTGLPMPDGNGTIQGLSAPAINNHSQVAFRAYAGNTTSNASFFAVCVRDRLQIDITQLARERNTAPVDISRYDSLGGPYISDLALNEGGTVFFWAALASTPLGNFDDTAIFRGSSANGSVYSIFREGDLEAGKAWDHINFQAQLAVNDFGQLAIRQKILGPQVTSTNNDAIVRFGNTFPSGTIIARESDSVPGRPGYFDTFFDPMMNDRGWIAFRAGLSGTTNGVNDNVGFYLSDGSNVMEVARTSYEGGFYELIGSTIPINRHDQVAFVAQIYDGTNYQNAVFFCAIASPSEIARTGNTIPRSPNKISGFSPHVDLNDSFQVAFAASLSPTGEAILRGKFGILKTVALTGDTLPGRTNVITSLHHPKFALNNHGQMVFLARIDEASMALLFHDDAIGLVEIAKYGDELLGSTIVGLDFIGTSFNETVPRQRNGFNDLGEVAFWFALADGTQGIARWNSPKIGITRIIRSENGVIISYTTLGNRPTFIESSPNLLSGFTTVASNYFANDGDMVLTNFTDAGVLTNSPQRFYRLRHQPVP